MSSANKVILLGRLGQDPETRQTQGGAVCKFSLATDNGYGEKRTTDWHRVVTFGRTAEACGKFLAKGRMAFIVGRIRYSEWEKDGVKRREAEIIADDVQFVGSNGRDEEKNEPASEGGFGGPDGMPF